MHSIFPWNCAPSAKIEYVPGIDYPCNPIAAERFERAREDSVGLGVAGEGNCWLDDITL
jgi:hypothetical protein